MKSYALLGFLLIVLGILAFAYQGLTYATREESVDIGALNLTAGRTAALPMPPLVGALALAGGLMVLATGGKKYGETAKRQNRRWLR